MTRLPRGLKNNNPLNIRRGTSSWQGLKERQTDPDFCQFKTIEYGFRAAFRLLHTYHYTLGLHTLRDIINRWAPPAENNTSAYLDTVTGLVQLYNGRPVGAHTLLPVPGDDRRLWCAIVRAMFAVECGRGWAEMPSTANEVAEGWRMAFGRK